MWVRQVCVQQWYQGLAWVLWWYEELQQAEHGGSRVLLTAHWGPWQDHLQVIRNPLLPTTHGQQGGLASWRAMGSSLNSVRHQCGWKAHHPQDCLGSDDAHPTSWSCPHFLPKFGECRDIWYYACQTENVIYGIQSNNQQGLILSRSQSNHQFDNNNNDDSLNSKKQNKKNWNFRYNYLEERKPLKHKN